MKGLVRNGASSSRGRQAAPAGPPSVIDDRDFGADGDRFCNKRLLTYLLILLVLYDKNGSFRRCSSQPISRPANVRTAHTRVLVSSHNLPA